MGVVTQRHDRRLLKLTLKDSDVVATVGVDLISEATATPLLLRSMLYSTDAIILDLHSDAHEVAKLFSLHFFAQDVQAFAYRSFCVVTISWVLLTPLLICEIAQLVLEPQHEVVVLHAKVVLVMELPNAHGL